MAIIETVRKVSKLKGAVPPEEVTTSERIEAIIKTIISERKTLEVAIDERLQVFSSSQIIDKGLFEGNPCLILDTLIPKPEGIRALESSLKLEIGFRRNDVPHTFESTFYTLSEDRSPTVCISYPKVVYLHQFRGAYRISPTTGEPVYVNIEFTTVKRKQETNGPPVSDVDSEKTKKIQEQKDPVGDISIDGMAFFTKNGNLTKGTEIFVDFEVPGSGHFASNAVVMNLSRTESSKYPFKCGIRFEDISKAEKELIYHYIMELQRQELKKQQGLA